MFLEFVSSANWMRIWICEEFLKMRDILTYVHMLMSKNPAEREKLKVPTIIEKEKSMLKVSDTE